MQRLCRVAPLRPCNATNANIVASNSTKRDDEQSPAASAPPRLLSDDQMRDYITNGYIALSVSDLPVEWHNAFWQRCHDWLFRGEASAHPGPDGGPSRSFVYPDIPELCDVTLSPTIRGALTSILGPGYAQHPHRTMHNYGKANGCEDEIGQDQTWHKDGHHVPMRSHHPRWVIIFFYPHAVSEDMGPTAILPGATYTTIDHDEPAHDALQDVLEAYLETEDNTARKQTNNSEHAQQLKKSGFSDLQIRDEIRGSAESAAVEMLGAAPPPKDSDRQVFGDDFAAGKWKMLCKTGTAVVMDYNIWHRGCRRMPGGLWRAMFKLQFFRTTAPATSGGNMELRAVPRPFQSFGELKTKQAIWEAIWRWTKGEPCIVDPSAACEVAAWERVIQTSDRDIDRVGAGYALGSMAAGDASLHSQQQALEALDRLLDGSHNARRAAMYGLASAGMPAVDLMMERITRPDNYPLSVVVAAVFALGEACCLPTRQVVARLGDLLVEWRRRMSTYCTEVACAVADTHGEISKTARARLTSGGATSMNPMDGFATALQRGTATVVLVLGMLAERVVANGDAALGRQLCELLLPVTCAPEPAEVLPPGFVRPAQAAYWVSEGAAFALLKLCSDTSTVVGNCIAPTAPCQHSDARFAPGFCLLAVRRAEMGGGGVVGEAVLPLLRASLSAWQNLYEVASADVPEPWLGGNLGGGVEWL